MTDKLILLPGKDAQGSRILRMPEDMDSREVFRNITATVASLEQQGGGVTAQDIDDALEDAGFELVDYIVGPEIE